MAHLLQAPNRADFSSPEEFEKHCLQHHERIAHKGSHLFVVCIDGSNQSDLAFKSALNMRGKYDHINVFHAFRGDKPDLQPATWRPKQLETKYECELVGNIPSRLHSMVFKDREGRPVLDVLKNTLMSTYTEAPDLVQIPDFVVMGHHGRKGPKRESTTLGSTTDQALRTLPFPCLVIKTVIPRGPKKVMMAVNASEVSKRGLEILMQVVNPRDSLTLLHFAPESARGSHTDQLQHYYEAELEQFGPVDSKFLFIDRDRSVPVTHAVVEFVNDSECDLFAIAPRAKPDRSSVTDHIVQHVLCSVLLCKC